MEKEVEESSNEIIQAVSTYIEGIHSFNKKMGLFGKKNIILEKMIKRKENSFIFKIENRINTKGKLRKNVITDLLKAVKDNGKTEISNKDIILIQHEGIHTIIATCNVSNRKEVINNLQRHSIFTKKLNPDREVKAYLLTLKDKTIDFEAVRLI